MGEGMTLEQAFERELAKLPAGAQQNIRESMQRGESFSFAMFKAGVNYGRLSQPAQAVDVRLHSGSAEDVAQWLYASGHHDAAFTVRQQLDVRNTRIKELELALSGEKAVRVGASTCYIAGPSPIGVRITSPTPDKNV